MELVGVADPASFATSVDRSREHLAAVRRDTGLERIILASDVLDDSICYDARGDVSQRGRQARLRSPFAGRVREHGPAGSRRRPTCRRLCDLGPIAVDACAEAGARRRGRASSSLYSAAPLMALVAAAVAIESGRPTLFAQRRGGLDGGRPFRMLKFRTMVPAPRRLLPALIDLDERSTPRCSRSVDDPRVTRSGRILRKCEPRRAAAARQRPPRAHEPRRPRPGGGGRLSPAGRRRASLPPDGEAGADGPMQISGRGELTFAERWPSSTTTWRITRWAGTCAPRDHGRRDPHRPGCAGAGH